MAGLIGVGRNTLGQASVGFQQSAGLEANRNAAQQQLDAARAAQRSSMVTTGAGLGGSIGVNNYMAAKAAAAKAGTGATSAAAPPVAVLSAPADLATSVGTQLGPVPIPVSEISGVGINSLASTTPELLLAEATSTAVPTVALEAAAPAAGELVGTLGTLTAPTWNDRSNNHRYWRGCWWSIDRRTSWYWRNRNTSINWCRRCTSSRLHIRYLLRLLVMAIDPAQSFSNALGQGLGIMKSYRDETRLDEDRAFEKSMKLETQRQAQEQLNLLIKGDKREQMRFDEDMTPERVALRGRKAVADVNLTEAQATDAGILASKRGKMIDTG